MNKDDIIERARENNERRMHDQAERIKARLVGHVEVEIKYATGYVMCQLEGKGRVGWSFFDFMNVDPDQIAEKLKSTKLGKLEMVRDSQLQVGEGSIEEEEDSKFGRNRVSLD